MIDLKERRSGDDSRSALAAALAPWRARFRRVDAVRLVTSWAWLGPAAALAVLLAARATPVPNDRWLALALTVATWLVLLAWPLLRRRPLANVARRMDRALGLKDRLATALALLDEPRGDPDLVRRQRADALAHSTVRDPAAALPLRPDRHRLALAGALLAAALALAVWPNPQHAIMAQRAAVEQAAEETADEVDALRDDLEDDAALDADERAELDAVLSDLSDALRGSGGRPEDTLAELAAAEGALRQLEDPAALQRASDAARLSDQLGALAEAAGRAPSDDVSDAAALADAVAELSPSERSALAERLAELAAGAGLPQAGDALERMADATAAGDAAAARQAADALDAALAQTADEAASARAARDAQAAVRQGRQAVASAAREAQASTLAQAGPLSGGTGADGDGGPRPDADGGSQASDDGAGQRPGERADVGGSGGDGAGPSAAQRPGDGAAGAGQPSDGEGASGGPAAGQDQGSGAGAGEGAADSAEQGQGAGQGDGTGQGAGDGAAGGDGESAGGGSGTGGGFGRAGTGRGDGEAVPGGGSDAYELTGPPQSGRTGASDLVYAPPERTGDAGQRRFIPGRRGVQGAAGPGWEQESRGSGLAPPALVPFDRVFGRYREAAGAALERDAVPPSLRDYVRQYFSQLEPQ